MAVPILKSCLDFIRHLVSPIQVLSTDNKPGCLICGPVSDWMILRLARRHNGVYEPEMRLWVFVPFIPFQVAGAFWFGYAIQQGESWGAVAAAFGICNFGSAPIQSVALTYIIDAYNEVCALFEDCGCGGDHGGLQTSCGSC